VLGKWDIWEVLVGCFVRKLKRIYKKNEKIFEKISFGT